MYWLPPVEVYFSAFVNCYSPLPVHKDGHFLRYLSLKKIIFYMVLKMHIYMQEIMVIIRLTNNSSLPSAWVNFLELKVFIWYHKRLCFKLELDEDREKEKENKRRQRKKEGINGYDGKHLQRGRFQNALLILVGRIQQNDYLGNHHFLLSCRVCFFS